MGQAAVKIDASGGAAGSAQVVRLNTDPRPKQPVRADQPAGAPALPSQLPAILEIVSRAATVSGQRKDRAAIMEDRALAAEERVAQMTVHVADAEARMRSAVEDMERERLRAEDLGRRSAELIKRTQAMLSDANDLRLAAEWRAAQAEESFATLRAAVEKGFADSL